MIIIITSNGYEKITIATPRVVDSLRGFYSHDMFQLVSIERMKQLVRNDSIGLKTYDPKTEKRVEGTIRERRDSKYNSKNYKVIMRGFLAVGLPLLIITSIIASITSLDGLNVISITFRILSLLGALIFGIGLFMIKRILEKGFIIPGI